MMKKLLRFWFGVLSVELTGKSAARFFSLCVKRGITLWNMDVIDEHRYHFSIYMDDFLLVGPIRKKTHVKLKILKKSGAPRIFHLYRYRIAFLVSFLFAGICIYRMTDYIWKIEIDGNSYLSDECVIQYLNNQGWGYGTKKDDIDLRLLELSLRTDFDEVIWSSSYVEGTKLVVKMQENLIDVKNKLSTVELAEGCWNIVADCDGTILSIITRNGTPNIKEGEEFCKGDILVSGKEAIIDDAGEIAEYLYLPADADIYAFVEYDFSDTFPAMYESVRETGRKRYQYYLGIGEGRFYFPFWIQDYETTYFFNDYHQVKLFDNLYLPFYYGKIVRCEQEKSFQYLAYTDAKEIAEHRFADFLTNLEENGVSIIRKNVMIEKNGNQYEVTGKVYVNQKVGCYEYE